MAGFMDDDLPTCFDDPLRVSLSRGPGYVVISVAGEIDIATEGAFRDALALALAGGALRVVVDLAGVAFMGSTGIGVLLGARKALVAEGGSLALASPAGEVAQILALTGVSAVIPVEASVADAVARWAA